MFIDAARIRYRGFIRPDGSTERQWNDIKRQAWLNVGEHYHRVMTPKHFERPAKEEYDYAPRSGEVGSDQPNFWKGYAGWKQKHLPEGNLDLVLSGELRDCARLYRVEAVSTSSRSMCRIILPAAQKANLQNPHSKVNMREELTAVSAAEGEELAKVLDDGLRNVIEASVGTFTHDISWPLAPEP
ncbi:MAG: hypothetical protein ABSG68_11375 [Thermoguttaceae bacterium]|jgi:hypothetical protein